METLIIEVTHPKGMAILRDLEDLAVIRVVRQEKQQPPKQRLSDIIRGSITPEEADALNKYVQESRQCY
jgi:hypothetical protein